MDMWGVVSDGMNPTSARPCEACLPPLVTDPPQHPQASCSKVHTDTSRLPQHLVLKLARFRPLELVRQPEKALREAFSEDFLRAQDLFCLCNTRTQSIFQGRRKLVWG